MEEFKKDEISSFTIRFTKRADADAIVIKNYLLEKFTQREVDNFYKLPETFEKVILVLPELYRLVTMLRKYAGQF